MRAHVFWWQHDVTKMSPIEHNGARAPAKASMLECQGFEVHVQFRTVFAIDGEERRIVQDSKIARAHQSWMVGILGGNLYVSTVKKEQNRSRHDFYKDHRLRFVCRLEDVVDVPGQWLVVDVKNSVAEVQPIGAVHRDDAIQPCTNSWYLVCKRVNLDDASFARHALEFVNASGAHGTRRAARRPFHDAMRAKYVPARDGAL